MNTKRSMVVLTLLFVWVPAYAFACAMFTFTDGDSVFMGNNEDFIKPGYVWFEPATKRKFGRVNLGFSDRFCQGSMNDQGLSFDAAVVAEIPYERDKKKSTPENLIEKIMYECATVDEAVAYFEHYNCPHLSRTQFMFADKSGDSAAIAWLPEKGLSVVRKDGPYQLITNTRLEISKFRCERYVLAELKLAAASGGDLAELRDVLAEIHQRGAQAFTSYSNIFDLTRGDVIVYNLADYSESITLNLAEELAKGAHSLELGTLFKKTGLLEAIKESEPRTYDTEVPLGEDALARIAGTYRIPAPPTEMTLAVDGNGLILWNPQSRPAHLYPESETLFRIREGGQITIELNEQGEVRGFTLHRFGDHYAARVQ